VAKKSTTSSSRRGRSRASSKDSSRKEAKSGRSRKIPSRSPRRGSSKSSFRLSERKLDILALILVGLGIFSLLSFFSPQQGVVTGFWLKLLQQGFGWGMVFLPFAFLFAGVWLLRRSSGDRFLHLDPEQYMGIFLLYLALLIVFYAALGAKGGGLVGAALLTMLHRALGNAGTVIVMLAWIVIGLIFVAGISVPELLDYGARAMRWLRERLPQWPRPVTKRKTPPISKPTIQATEPQVKETASLGRPTPALVTQKPPEALSTPARAPQEWSLPRLEDILEPGIPGQADAALDQERAGIIEDTLKSFGAPARVVEINRGPTITQFGVEPDYTEGRGGRRTKVKVSKISALADDLALALAAPSIRIEAPVPGKGFVGVEVPNEVISLVSLRDVMEAEGFRKVRTKLRLGLGKNVSGKAIAADLGTMPHLLVAGTTGSGKSVCINAIVTCLLLQNTPENLKLIMIDPKRVELTNFNGIPHLMAPVIVDLDQVVGALKWLSREMDERYRRFAKEGVRNISEYNQRMESLHQPELPFIVMVIDELADLMMLAPDETERLITRMAQLARATGIHLVIATQRPSVDVVTGLIKANFPARIAFAVASSVDSRVILDQPGAERLLGRGDMLFHAPDASAPVRMQGAYVSEMELARLIRFWRNAALGGETTRPVSVMSEETLPAGLPLKQVPLWEEMEMDEEGADVLFDEAVVIVREMRRASISLLQRRMRIGYTRSARLIDQLEERGIIGPATGGSQPREVLDYGEFVQSAEES